MIAFETDIGKRVHLFYGLITLQRWITCLNTQSKLFIGCLVLFFEWYDIKGNGLGKFVNRQDNFDWCVLLVGSDLCQFTTFDQYSGLTWQGVPGKAGQSWDFDFVLLSKLLIIFWRLRTSLILLGSGDLYWRVENLTPHLSMCWMLTSLQSNFLS